MSCEPTPGSTTPRRPHGYPINRPWTLVGTVDSVQAVQIVLWVRKPGCGTSGGWWAHLKHEDAEKHMLRPA